MDNKKIYNVADYIIKLSTKKLGDEEWERDGITNLKIQKILYFAQAYGLVKDNPLFSDDFQAWKYGPVLEDLYHNYKEYKNNFLEVSPDFNENSLTEGDKNILSKVWNSFGKFSAGKLVNMTHEKPWEDAFNRGQNTVISKTDIKEYYKSLFV